MIPIREIGLLGIILAMLGCAVQTEPPPDYTAPPQGPELAKHGCVTSLGLYPCPDGNELWVWSKDGQTWNYCTSPIDGDNFQPGDECRVPGLASGPQEGVCQ